MNNACSPSVTVPSQAKLSVVTVPKQEPCDDQDPGISSSTTNAGLRKKRKVSFAPDPQPSSDDQALKQVDPHQQLALPNLPSSGAEKVAGTETTTKRRTRSSRKKSNISKPGAEASSAEAGAVTAVSLILPGVHDEENSNVSSVASAQVENSTVQTTRRRQSRRRDTKKAREARGLVRGEEVEGGNGVVTRGKRVSDAPALSDNTRAKKKCTVAKEGKAEGLFRG